MLGNMQTFIVPPENRQIETAAPAASGKWRLDAWLAAQPGLALSRSQIRNLIVAGQVTVNGRPAAKPGHWVRPADALAVTRPELRPLGLVAENIPLDILYEDEQLIVLNKPAGMVVHPAPGHAEGTLVHALLHHCQTLSGIGGVQRPGIIHRLDRDTSGVMLVAKTDFAHQHLSRQLKSRELTRLYHAIVHGRFNALSGSIEAPLQRQRQDRKKIVVAREGGRYALTLYQVMQQFAAHAFLKIELKTGRTHQIRVHLKHIHHPVVGDPMYGNASQNNLDMPRQALHAQTVAFTHPVSGARLTFTTALPDDMQRILTKLKHADEAESEIA